MYKGDGFSEKPLGESLFHCQDVWSSHGPTGQFWLLESVIRGLELKNLKFKDVITGFFFQLSRSVENWTQHTHCWACEIWQKGWAVVYSQWSWCARYTTKKRYQQVCCNIFGKLPVHTSCNILIQTLLLLFCLKEGRLAAWPECWTCNSEALEVHTPLWLLSRFVLGSPEFKSLSTLVKEPTGLPPSSWDS